MDCHPSQYAHRFQSFLATLDVPYAASDELEPNFPRHVDFCHRTGDNTSGRSHSCFRAGRDSVEPTSYHWLLLVTDQATFRIGMAADCGDQNSVAYLTHFRTWIHRRDGSVLQRFPTAKLPRLRGHVMTKQQNSTFSLFQLLSSGEAWGGYCALSRQKSASP